MTEIENIKKLIAAHNKDLQTNVMLCKEQRNLILRKLQFLYTALESLELYENMVIPDVW